MTSELRKTVDIKTVDEEARTATGAVLVPDELDHQHDFLRADAVQTFHADNPETGVMHSAFPTDAANLERNEVIDEPEKIGDETYPKGTWVATRRYEDDRLWQLVKEGVLQGFSIGGEITRAAGHDQLPDDVRVPDSVDHDGDGGTELLAGTVGEVSDVDIPAVPRARYKGTPPLGKNLLDDVDSESEFVELMVDERGHSEEDARALYRYLDDARANALHRTDALGKPFESPDGAEFEDFDDCVETLVDDDMTRAEAEAVCGSWQEEDKTDLSMTDSDSTNGIDDATKLQVIKSWLTGSDDGVSPERGQSEVPEDAAKASDEDDEDAPDDDDDDEAEEDDAEMSADSDTAHTMSDSDSSSDEPPEWAKSLADDIESIDKRVTEIESPADDDAEKADDDTPEWAADLAEKVDDLETRVETISKQSGHSQQLSATDAEQEEQDDAVAAFKAGLVGRGRGGD